MNALTRLCLNTTADVLEQIVIAIRGTQSGASADPATPPLVVNLHVVGDVDLDAIRARPSRRFGRGR